MNSQMIFQDLFRPCMSRNKYALGLLFISIFGISGCTIPYPSNFASLTKTDESYGKCPDIEGRYNDKGDIISLEGKPIGKISLTYLLHGGEESSFDKVDTIVIIGHLNNLIEAHSLTNGTEIFSWSQSAEYKNPTGNYVCKRGYVVLNLWSYANVSIPPVHSLQGYRNLWCRRAVDGSLIVLDREANRGLILVLPYWSDNNIWYRFRPVKEAIN